MSRLMISLTFLFILSCSSESADKDAGIVPKIAHPVVHFSDPKNLRLSDLSSIPYALEEYKIKHRSYPISSDGGSGWDGFYSKYGESRPDWIRGLVPEFLPSLPRDPRMNKQNSEQYLYRSDGANYKLIAHSPDDCNEVSKIFPMLVDPIRNCWAYGYWTVKAARW